MYCIAVYHCYTLQGSEDKVTITLTVKWLDSDDRDRVYEQPYESMDEAILTLIELNALHPHKIVNCTIVQRED
jgi:hypothetical protein